MAKDSNIFQYNKYKIYSIARHRRVNQTLCLAFSFRKYLPSFFLHECLDEQIHWFVWVLHPRFLPVWFPIGSARHLSPQFTQLSAPGFANFPAKITIFQSRHFQMVITHSVTANKKHCIQKSTWMIIRLRMMTFLLLYYKSKGVNPIILVDNNSDQSVKLDDESDDNDLQLHWKDFSGGV